MGTGLRRFGPARPTRDASYSVSVRQVAALLPRFFQTAPRGHRPCASLALHPHQILGRGLSPPSCQTCSAHPEPWTPRTRPPLLGKPEERFPTATTGSFFCSLITGKCYPCSRLTLLPMFPVAPPQLTDHLGCLVYVDRSVSRNQHRDIYAACQYAWRRHRSDSCSRPAPDDQAVQFFRAAGIPECHWIVGASGLRPPGPTPVGAPSADRCARRGARAGRTRARRWRLAARRRSRTSGRRTA